MVDRGNAFRTTMVERDDGCWHQWLRDVIVVGRRGEAENIVNNICRTLMMVVGQWG